MASDLTPDLIERLRERASDPERRSDAASLSGSTVSLESLLGQLGASSPRLGGLMGQLAGTIKGMSVMTPMPDSDASEREAQPLPAPASDEQIASAEQAVGRSLPAALTQLYREIADGGFGPGGGLFPLARAIDEYREMTSEPAGPQNQPWPTNLLPLIDAEPGYDCIDLDTGAVVAWDPEEIDSASNAAWQRSFKPVAAGIAEWLEEWLSQPTAGERMAERQASWQAQGRSMAAQGMVNFYAKKTSEERAAMGLPEVGWEEELLRRNGLL